MNARIIAGKYGGRTIKTPQKITTHPMAERVRGSLFNIINNELEGAMVLDAFAGSGALGLEALSRGAKQALFIEKDRIAQKVITENIAALGVESQAKAIKARVGAWDSTAPEESQFDIIFADPPYHDVQFSTVEKLFKRLKPNGLMVLSHPDRECVPSINGVVVVDNRSYGDAVLTLYRQEKREKSA